MGGDGVREYGGVVSAEGKRRAAFVQPAKRRLAQRRGYAERARAGVGRNEEMSR